MAENEHTPGPWEWDAGVVPPDGPERYADIYVDGGETIIANFNNALSEGKANARLIAAAPDLLECLKLLLAYMTDGESPPSSFINSVEAAIDRAEGRS